ncbi:hypothetical protein RHP47_11030 [Thermosynechococcus sp. QKsg1]|uniref:hypothetical protein n=1 Tax=unclassified Thermosynechococcus TaxID=2622553 RepID=UPI00122E46ED|nr:MULTISPECIES: hypothetical protein [unclassified Thermosynechococcus]QEQ01858.1 hypothetical protein FFX45_11020 [Thermosynechococcus sp. CL-1]WJI23734.1 hypothetical protein MZ909_11060 [Thermosynechococcus sp. B0]WJI26247.1 hypothetical protein M0644_11100 [Thermosynechococcus sp. B1]WJI28774.1 hypothetical protein M0646_11095 [Thermosynechococcus sp. B3]WKT83365.1 hypothetical protein QYC28_11165 [Thermosynechococcus sp. HY596]
MASPEPPSNQPDDLLENIITDLGELDEPPAQDIDLNSLTAELESLTLTAEQRAIAQNQALQEQISQLTAELHNVQQQRDQLSQDLARLQEENATLSGLRQNLEQELAQALIQQDELQQQLVTLQLQASQIQELQSQVATLQSQVSQIQELQDQLASLQTEKTALEQQLQAVLAASPPAPLEDTALLGNPPDAGLAQQLAEITRQLTQVERERDRLQEELAQAQNELLGLQHDLEVLRNQSATVVPTELTLAAQENRQLKRQQRRRDTVLWISGIAATVVSALSVSLNLPQPIGRIIPPVAALAVPVITTLVGRGGSSEKTA